MKIGVYAKREEANKPALSCEDVTSAEFLQRRKAKVKLQTFCNTDVSLVLNFIFVNRLTLF